MRLLFDHNLAARLVERLADLFPDSIHTSRVGLARVTDEQIWRYARDREMGIVTKDSDFNQLGLLHGAPAKIIWIRAGNRSTSQIEELLVGASVPGRRAWPSRARLRTF